MRCEPRSTSRGERTQRNPLVLYRAPVCELTEILQCRYGDLACPGDSTANPATGPDPYCAAEYEGPLCSQCTEEYFASWDGGGACQKCAAGKSHAPTIGLGAGVFGFVGLLLACASKFCQKRDTGEAPPNAFLVEAEKLYLLADVKFFTLFLSAQADTLVLSFVRSLSLALVHLPFAFVLAGHVTIRNHIERQGRRIIPGACCDPGARSECGEFGYPGLWCVRLGLQLPPLSLATDP